MNLSGVHITLKFVAFPALPPSVLPSQGPLEVVALYDYVKQGNQELDLKEGDIITLLAKVSEVIEETEGNEEVFTHVYIVPCELVISIKLVSHEDHHLWYIYPQGSGIAGTMYIHHWVNNILARLEPGVLFIDCFANLLYYIYTLLKHNSPILK